ncbi:MAG: response regulator transcription factor [Candidatus Sumerlaeaceae bacterium]|nr:response regulator transcription factor [Candidatus Sumerlaeaceae bacterium]
MSPIRSVLVVEDEQAISNLVSFHLEQNGYEPVVASEGRRALGLLEKRVPSLVILDLMLPDIDGIEVLKRLRAMPACQRLPVILLTARAEEGDRVLGLEVGADDYVTKPFSPRELMLRVQKLIASRETVETASVPTVFGCLEIDEDKFRVVVDGSPIEISATEMKLLVELMRSRGRVLSRNQILQSAWGFMPNVTERTVDTHVKRLRQKLGAASPYLETVRGVGYRWVDSPPEEAFLSTGTDQ